MIVRNIEYMLKNSFSDVRFNDGKEEKWIINKGSRQWSIISPMLFTFYLKGYFEDMFNYDVGCKIGLIKSNVLAYADVIVLMASTLRL